VVLVRGAADHVGTAVGRGSAPKSDRPSPLPRPSPPRGDDSQSPPL